MMLERLKPLVRRGLSNFWVGADRMNLAPCRSLPVAYVVERGEGWSIRWDGEYYARSVNCLYPGTLGVIDRPERLVGRIAHFGSQFVWQLWTKALHPSNRQLVTFFHGKPEDGQQMARHIDFLLSNLNRVEKVVTAASMVEERLLAWGVPSSKLCRVPLGVDTKLFRPPTDMERQAARQAFGIPEDCLCIGSFQKDGVGWGDGMEPKLIKGPDLFVEVVSRLAKRFPIFVLLTGPARGYVMSGLERNKVRYAHVYLKDYLAIASAYQALDLYLMTSREEGGPKALLESLSSGTGLVSFRVGMAQDLLTEENDPRMAEEGNLSALLQKAEILLSDEFLRRRLANAGRQTALAFDWSVVARSLYERAYRELL